MRTQITTWLMLAILLVSCTLPTAITPAQTTPITVTASNPVSTAIPSTSIPTLPADISITELKYQLLTQFPNLFFCDPDYYPVARADEGELARQVFPELQANPEEFQAILNHNNFRGLVSFTDEQKLLIYREHKKLRAIILEPAGDDYQFQLQIDDNQGQGFIVKGLLDQNGLIKLQQREPSFATCPICLAAHTQIDTPRGFVAVENLHVGDEIWTLDTIGMRSAAIILKTVRVFVPFHYQILHITLSDGRELSASPGHPTTDGRIIRDLRLGDLLDGAHITYLAYINYNQPATYDILPSGGTGFYWADGILVGSTLTGQ